MELVIVTFTGALMKQFYKIIKYQIT